MYVLYQFKAIYLTLIGQLLLYSLRVPFEVIWRIFLNHI